MAPNRHGVWDVDKPPRYYPRPMGSPKINGVWSPPTQHAPPPKTPTSLEGESSKAELLAAIDEWLQEAERLDKEAEDETLEESLARLMFKIDVPLKIRDRACRTHEPTHEPTHGLSNPFAPRVLGPSFTPGIGQDESSPPPPLPRAAASQLLTRHTRSDSLGPPPPFATPHTHVTMSLCAISCAIHVRRGGDVGPLRQRRDHQSRVRAKLEAPKRNPQPPAPAPSALHSRRGSSSTPPPPAAQPLALCLTVYVYARSRTRVSSSPGPALCAHAPPCAHTPPCRFRVHIRGVGLERFPVEQVDELFMRWDLDGGGTIDMDELEQALKSLRTAFIKKHGEHT